MSEKEQEKLYELLFKDTKNKLEATIEKQQKEIKELKEKEKNLLNQLKDNEKELLEVTQNVISKDIIRKHLKKFEEIEKEFIFIDNKSTAREINKILIEFSKRLLEE